jgi:hypothetical protein
MLVHLPCEEGYGAIPRTKSGPALDGYGALSMNKALTPIITTLPEQLRRSLTWDRGKELSQHAQFKPDTGGAVYFADPHSPWQRGANENTNGLLRQYFPKGTDLARWSREELQAVAHALNSRPRKALGWKTPDEALNEYLLSAQEAGIATTGRIRPSDECFDVATVGQDAEERARHAVRAAVQRLDQGRVAFREIALVPRLIVRGTTAAFARLNGRLPTALSRLARVVPAGGRLVP